MSKQLATEPTHPFLRDSLAFHIGLLGRQALRRVFGDRELTGLYAKWLQSGGPCTDECADPCEHCATLLEFGLSNGGQATLYAHRNVAEFELLCVHDHFEFTALLAFDPPSERLDGLCVAQFHGDPSQAVRWIHTATIDVGRLDFEPWPSPAGMPRLSN